MAWTDVIGLEGLGTAGKAVVRRGGRQVLVLHTPKGVFACANRCPHEGYPLSEGVLTDGCVLTCNWHNWKFDLSDGRTLVGGDALRRFPTRIEDGRVLVDLSPEEPSARRQRVLAGLRQALEDEDQDRLVREAARLMSISRADEAILAAVDWAADRLEFGTTHAFAAAPDWLALHDSKATRPEEKLAGIGEILGNVAEDVRGGARFPFAAGQAPWNENVFAQAIETEDETAAIALLRGALAAGLSADDLLPTLARAALAHYADFGHSLIYTVKTVALIDRLGPTTAEPLLSLLARSLIYARREDLLPEFRSYRERINRWGSAAGRAPPLEARALRKRSAKSAMEVVGAWSAYHPPEAIFDVLVEMAAWMLLHVDESQFVRTDGKIADNVGWLDFTHAITFADAGVVATAAAPDLWPALLLQLACFIGRNAAWVDPDLDVAAFEVVDRQAFVRDATALLFDHGQVGFIVPAHLVKTLTAATALAAARPTLAPILLAATNRFLHARMKRRHVLRTARQMRAFVAQE